MGEILRSFAVLSLQGNGLGGFGTGLGLGAGFGQLQQEPTQVVCTCLWQQVILLQQQRLQQSKISSCHRLKGWAPSQSSLLQSKRFDAFIFLYQTLPINLLRKIVYSRSMIFTHCSQVSFCCQTIRPSEVINTFLLWVFYLCDSILGGGSPIKLQRYYFQKQENKENIPRLSY